MSAVWYSLAIYIVGISSILFLRPTFMFHPNGTWKEFGMTNTVNHTMFPFWMFVIVWTIVSFALANVIQIFLASTVLQTINPNVRESILQPISATVPSPPQSATDKVPGYYVLDRLLNPEPRYVYWGPNPPTASNLHHVAPAQLPDIVPPSATPNNMAQKL